MASQGERDSSLAQPILGADRRLRRPSWHRGPGRSAFGIVSDLAAAGYIVKEKGDRRNRYRVEADRPLPESAEGNLAIGDLLALLGGSDAGLPGTEREPG